MTHPVHVLPIVRVGCLFPRHFNLASLYISEGDSVTPPALDLIRDLASSRIYTSDNAMIARLGPAPLEKFQLRILVFGFRAVQEIGFTLHL